MTVNTKSLLTISASPDFKSLLKECTKTYRMGSVSQFIRVAVYDYIDKRTNGAVYGDNGKNAINTYLESAKNGNN